jgi:uncharacterized protein YbjT (DUF2867 family)
MPSTALAIAGASPPSSAPSRCPASSGDSERVIGSNGKTGRRVAERLKQTERQIRIGSRRADSPFDWNLPATWGLPLEGATATYVTYQPDLAVPGALASVEAFFAQAIDCGVRKILL